MLKLLHVRSYLGANIHCAFPAIAGRLEIAVPLAAPAVAAIGGLPAYFRQAVPEFATAEPALEPNLPADPVAALGLMTAWLTAQLQNIADGHISDFAVGRDAQGAIHALCGYQLPALAGEAMQLACALLDSCLQDAANGAAVPPLLQQQVTGFAQSAFSWHYDQTTRAILSAAKARNIPYYRISPAARFAQLGQGAFLHHLFETESDRTPATGAKISANKVATSHLLSCLGVPTPPLAAVGTFEQAAAAASSLGYPLVVKPTHGSQGQGITVGVGTAAELQAAVRHAAGVQRGGVLIEKFVPGEDHRLLVVGGRLIAAARRVPAQVTGDGTHTIKELVEIVNRDPRRGEHFRRELAIIVRDAGVDSVLAGQGYQYSSVPIRGALVYLRKTANLATGGTAADVTSTVHPDVREIAELIARTLKLDVAGIDYLTTDITRSYRETGGAVCEVNSCPGLNPHWVAGNDRAKILDAILDLQFPAGKTGRVPVVAIAGSATAGAVCRLVAAMLEATGKTTAVVSSAGVMVGSRPAREGDCAGGSAARAIFMDPRVEAVVLELAFASLHDAGLPFDECDVAAVFDSGGRTDAGAVNLLAVNSLITRAATRAVVLNADDAHCLSLAGTIHDAPICWVAADAANSTARSRLRAGDSLVTLLDGGKFIALQKGGSETRVTSIDELGTNSVTTALRAVAVGCTLDIAPEHIRRGLRPTR